MGQRLLLQAKFEELLGSENVYFQPPNNTGMEYPCIVFKLDDEQRLHADNSPYRRVKRYQATIIDEDPDSEIPDKVADLPMCAFDRFFTAGDLNHTVYNLFF